MKNNPEEDLLKTLFQYLPEKELPSFFCEQMMHKITAETVKIKKRKERLTLFAVIMASLVMVALAIFSLLYMGTPDFMISFSLPDFSSLPSMPFYTYIGALSLLLLFLDHIMRKIIMRKIKNDLLRKACKSEKKT